MYVDSISNRRGSFGFSLVELLVTAVILTILASVALPMVEVAVQRTREEELRDALLQIRQSLNEYKKAVDTGHILKIAEASGYPPSLQTLVDGVPDLLDPHGARIRFLRRVPRDPFGDAGVAATEVWGKRSYASEADAPQEGVDVYDVFSKSAGVGLNGIPYRQW